MKGKRIPTIRLNLWQRLFMAFVAAGGSWFLYSDVMSGTLHIPRSGPIYRADDPVAFWFFVSLYMLLAAVTLLIAAIGKVPSDDDIIDRPER